VCACACVRKVPTLNTESNKTTVRNVIFLCSLFTTLTYTTYFDPSWWPSSVVTTIIYKGCSLLPTDPFESGLASMVYLHNIKLYVNINNCRCVL
jgi:hypothetical protein